MTPLQSNELSSVYPYLIKACQATIRRHLDRHAMEWSHSDIDETTHNSVLAIATMWERSRQSAPADQTPIETARYLVWGAVRCAMNQRVVPLSAEYSTGVFPEPRSTPLSSQDSLCVERSGQCDDGATDRVELLLRAVPAKMRRYLRERADGHTMREACARVGVSRDTVSRYLPATRAALAPIVD